MANFSDLRDYVLPELRGIEPETVDFYIRQVGRDFLKTTTLWRETILLPLQVGLTDYRLTPRNGGQVAGVLKVGRADNSGGVVHNLREAERPGPGFVADAGEPDGWWQVYPGVIKLRRPPDKVYQLPILVYKQLTLDPSDDLLPDEAFDVYAETLAYGVKARLHAMPSKPWTDTMMATVNNGLYTQQKFAVRAKLREGGAYSHGRVVAPRFAGR